MKKIIKFSLMLVVALTTMNASAGDIDFSLNVKAGQGKMVRFTLNEVNKIDLSIYDAEGKLIHTENVNSKGNLNRTYDLNSLPEGSYYLQAESEMKIVRYQISVAGDSALLATTAVSEVYKPIIAYTNGLVSVSVLNLDKSAVTIKIYDDESNELYTSGILRDQKVKKFFDLKELANGKFTFVISYDNEIFEKEVVNR